MQLSWKNFPFAEYFGLEKKPLLALDIGSSCIKIMQVAKTSMGYKITHMDLAPLQPYSLLDKTIKSPEHISQVLNSVVSKLKLDTDWVICSVSGSFVIMRTIQLAKDLTDEEMADEIELDADKYIPYPLEEVNLDYTVMHANAEHPNTLNDVLLTACRTQQVESRISVVKSVNFKLKVVEIDAFGFSRAFPFIANQIPKCGINQTVALIDIGASTMSLTVFNNFELIYSREHYFGGLQLTEEISRRYGLSFFEAETAKIMGNLPDDYFIEVLDPYRTTIIQNIGRFLQFFFSSEKSLEINYLVLTGGGSKLPGLDLLIQDKLLYKTFLPNPIAEMQLADHIDPIWANNVAPQFMLTLGLALRDIV